MSTHFRAASHGRNKAEQWTDEREAALPATDVLKEDPSGSRSVDLPPRPLTEEQVRMTFIATGTTVADWARERGFSISLTRMVLAGKRKCLRGQSHEIAVALGLKAACQ